jgi:ribonuclease P protein subunit POP4
MINRKNISLVKNLLRNSLIGYNIKVISHTDSGFVGLTGKLIDETRNMLILETDKTVKIQKLGGKYQFFIDDVKITISGRLIQHLPKRRRRKTHRIW